METTILKPACTKPFRIRRKAPKFVKFCDFCGEDVNYTPYPYEGFDICAKCNFRYRN